MIFAKGGTILPAQTLAQTTSQTIDLLGLDTVALQVNYANGTTGAKTFISGTYEVQTVTFPAVAASTQADYVVLVDASGLSWAIALDKAGSAVGPTGAIWTAIPAGRKTLVDISGGTDAASVAALCETAFDGLTGASAAFATDDSAADGTMTFTAQIPALLTAGAPHNGDDSGAGSITIAVTTPGVNTTVNVTDNTATITAHGQATGSKVALTTSSALPAGLAAQDYFLIVVDANTIKFATSLANAVAGTAVDITGYGVGTQTITPTTSAGNVIKAQASIDGTYWTDITTAKFPGLPDATVTVATTAGGVCWDLQRPTFRYVNILFTPSAGQITFSVLMFAKVDN